MESQTTLEINKAILAVQSEMPVIEKTANNPFYKSKYAPHDEIIRKARPLLAKNGLITGHSASIDHKELEACVYVKEKSESVQIVSIPMVTVRTRITHAVSGEWKEEEMTFPAEKGNAHGIQAVITYIKRQNTLMMLDIAVGDEDDDGNASVEPERNARPTERRPLNTQQERRPLSNEPSVEFNAMGHQFQQQGNKIVDVTTTTGKTLQEVNMQIKNAGKEQVQPDGDPGPSVPLFDDAGNINENAQPPEPKKESTPTGTPMTNAQRERAGLIIGEEYDKMKAALNGLKERGMNPKNWLGWLKLNYGVDSMQHIKRSDFPAIMEIIATDPRAIDGGIKE